MISSLFRRTRIGLLAVSGLLVPLGAPHAAASVDAGAYLAARQATLNNDYSAAAQWFSRALLADANNANLIEGLVNAHIGQGEFATAAAVASVLSEQGVSSLVGNIAVLAHKARTGDYEALLTSLPNLPINALVDPLTTAWALVGAGRMAEALTHFDTIIQNPDLASFGLYHKALALAYAGDYENAALLFSGEDAGAPSFNQRGIVAYAQVLSQLERHDEALKVLHAAYGESAHETEALRAQIGAKEIVDFDVITSGSDGISEIFSTLATVLSGDGNDRLALIYARAAQETNPLNINATLLAANTLYRLGQFELAIRAYDSVPHDHPLHINAVIGRADALYESGQIQAALNTLAKLEADNSTNFFAIAARASALQRAAQFGEAVDAYTRAIAALPSLGPQNWDLYYSRAIARERSGTWADAEADFRKALELNPEMPFVLNNLGYSLIDRKLKLDEALGMIKRAVQMDPENGAFLDSLAWAYFLLDRYDEAVVPMEEASLREPLDPTVTDHLGDVYWATGRKVEAGFQWRRALDYGPSAALAKRIKRKLDIGLDALLAEEGAAPLAPYEHGQNP